MRSLVTGGAGFIGSHLVDALRELGHEVVVVDDFSTGRRANLARHEGDPALRIVEADVGRDSGFEESFVGVDWVFHLAALASIVPSIEHPAEYFRANVAGTQAVLEAARHAGVKRLVYAASSSCYGLADELPTPETAEISPEYPYALTKVLAEQLVLHWCKVYGLPALSLRLFNVYGPRARTDGGYGAVFGVFLAQRIAGAPYTVVGDGEQSRDFTFVSDVVSAFLAAARSRSTGEIFNVGSGGTYSVNHLIGLLGGDFVRLPTRPGEPDSTFADTSKIQERLGWSPRVSFEEGVRVMLDHIEDWKAAPVWTPEAVCSATETWFRYLGPSSNDTENEKKRPHRRVKPLPPGTPVARP